jgi:hypothetical protein
MNLTLNLFLTAYLTVYKPDAGNIA